jgi:hypothetical protein
MSDLGETGLTQNILSTLKIQQIRNISKPKMLGFNGTR